MKKSEFAKELRCSPSTITWMVKKKGMPAEPDGSLDRDGCLHWIVTGTTGHRGGWGDGGRGASLRERAVALLAAGSAEPAHRKPAGPGAVPSGDTEFQRGARWMAAQVCIAARTGWPALVRDMNFDTLPARERLAARAFMVTIGLHLLEGWTAEYIDGAALPAVDWAAFGKDGARLRRDYEEYRAELSAA